MPDLLPGLLAQYEEPGVNGVILIRLRDGGEFDIASWDRDGRPSQGFTSRAGRIAHRIQSQELEIGICRVCGCADHEACIDDGGDPCSWTEPDLCSACDVPIAAPRRRPTLPMIDPEAHDHAR